MALLQKIKNLYRTLPPWVTAPVKCIPDGLLFGKSFRRCVPRIDLGYLSENIKRTLDYAREHTIWGHEHIPSVIEVTDALKIISDLPCVDTAEVAAEPQKFISDEANDFNSYTTTTGGSGRNPTTIRLDNASYGIEWAHMLKIWSLGGYVRRKDVTLTFRGYHLQPGELVRRDPIYNELSVDPFQLNDTNFLSLMRRIAACHVTCLHGYPSLIAMFMTRLKANGLRFPVREIMLGSEGVSVELKRELSDFFGAKVISWYGLSEKVVLAYDEDADGRFVNFTSYGYPRIVDADANGIGEIVGTTFVNKAMPLINYRTGDYGQIVEDSGRLIIEELQGRTGKDFVYKSRDCKFTMTAVNLHGPVQQKIVFYQIVQNEYGKILVKVLPKPGFSGDEIYNEMMAELAERLKGFDIVCRIVHDDTEFERSTRGKLIMLVQNLKV